MANNLHFEYRLNVNEDATKKNLKAFIDKTFGNGRNTKLSVPIKLDFANSLENVDFDSIQREIDRKFKGNVKIKVGINVDATNVKAQVQRQLDRIQKDLSLKVGLEVDPKSIKALSNSADVMGTLGKEVGKLKDDMKDLGKNLAIDSDVVDKSQYQEVLGISKDIGDENRKTEKSLKEQLQTQKEILKSKEEQMKQLEKEMSSENERLQTAKERKAINDDLIQQEKELQKEVKELDKQIKAEQERQRIYESQKTSLEEQQKTQEQLTKDLKETNDELNKLQSDKKYEDGRLELARQREQTSQEFIDSIHKENEALEEQLAKLEKVAEASGNVALTKAMSKRYNSPSNYTPIERTWEQEQSKARQAYLLNNKSQKIYQQIYNSDISKSIRDISSFDIKSVQEMDAHMKELGNTLAHDRGLLAQANELLDERVELTQENINKAKELADLIINEVSQVEIARGNRQGGADKKPYKRALEAYEANPSDDNLVKLERQAEKLAKIGAFYEYGAQGLKVLTALEDKYNVKAQKSLETQEALAENEAKRAQKHVRKTVASSEKESLSLDSAVMYKDAGDYLEAEVYGFTKEQLEKEMAKYAEKLTQSFKGKSMVDEDGFILYDRINKVLAKNEERLAKLDEKGAQALTKKMEEIKKITNSYEKLNAVLVAREGLGLDEVEDSYANLLGLSGKEGGTEDSSLGGKSVNYEGEAESLKKLIGQFILYCRQADIVKGQTNDLKMQFNDLSANYECLLNTATADEASWTHLTKSMAEYGDSIGVATDEMKEHIKIVESKQGIEPLTKSLEENSKARKNNAEAIKETAKALQEASKAQEQLDGTSSSGVISRGDDAKKPNVSKPSAESIAKELEEMFKVVATGKGDLEQVNALYEAMKDKLKDVNRVKGGGIAGSLRDVSNVSVGIRKGVEALETMTQAWDSAEEGSVESINKINESVKVLAENYNAIYGDKAPTISDVKGFTPTSVKTMGEIEDIRKKLEDNKTYLQLQEQNLKEAQKEAKAIEEINARLDKRLAKAQEIKAQQEEQLKLVEKASSASNGGEQLDGEGLEAIRKRIETLQQEKKLKETMASDLKGQIEQEEALGDVSDESLQRMKNRYEQLRAEAQSASNAINGITEAIQKQEKASSKMNTLSHNIVPTSNKASSSSSSSGGGGSSSASASSSQAKQESFITNELSERIKLRQRDLTLQLQNLAYGKELTANQKLMVHEMMNQIVALGSSVSSMKELNLESQKIKQNLNETKFNVKVTTTEDKDAVKKLEQQRKATEEMYKGMFDELEKQEKELLAIENMYARLFDQAELNAKVEERNKVVLEEKAQLTQRNLNLKIKEFEQSRLASHADQEQLQTLKSMVAEMDKNVDSAQELQSVVGKINTLYKEMQSGAKSNAEAKKLESLIATKEKDLALTHQSVANSKAYQNAIESQRVAFDQLASQLKLTGRSTEEVNKQYAQLSQQMKGMKLDMVTEQLGRQDTAFQKVLGSMKDYFVMNLDIMDCFRMVQQGFSNAFEHAKVLDEAYTNINMTMDITEKKFKTMVDTAYEVGNANGQLATEVLSMMKVYANAGTTVEEINSQMQATVAFQNVTGLDATSVTNSIQTIIQQYKLLEDGSMNAAEATEYLGDVMVGVSYNLAKEESDAMREVILGVETAGGMMKTSGASFEWFSSVIGTLAETMNASGSETANAINIFVAPYGNIGEQNSF